jgi:HK97 family phage prohead protease
MNRKQLIHLIRKRAGALDAAGDRTAISRYGYAVSEDEIGLAHTGALESAVADSAVFTITDSGSDRSGDRVNPRGVDLTAWRSAGCPVFWNHNTDGGMPIGSCINPRTGRMEVQIDDDRIRARVFFDLEDELGREIARKVHRGLIRACSISFLPRKARPNDHSSRSWDYEAVEMTELSLVPVGDNPRALLESPEGASPILAKSLRRCMGGKCFSKWIPVPDTDAPTLDRPRNRLGASSRRRTPSNPSRIVGPKVEAALTRLVAKVAGFVAERARN